jgi:hypothetical protein
MSLPTRPALHQEFTFLEQTLLISMAFTPPPEGVLIQDRAVLIQDMARALCMHESEGKIKRQGHNSLS